MTDDLVTRLRLARSYLANHPTYGSWEHAHSVEDGMDEIERLRAERDALKALLTTVFRDGYDDYWITTPEGEAWAQATDAALAKEGK